MSDEFERESAEDARLRQLLSLLRVDGEDDVRLASVVMRRLRWQVAVRGVAQDLADLVAVALAGLGVLVGRSEERPGDRP